MSEGYREVVPTLGEKEVAVTVQDAPWSVEGDNTVYPGFVVSLPKDYVFPNIEKSAPDESPAAGIVARNFVSEEVAWKQINSSPAFKDKRIHRPTYQLKYREGQWKLYATSGLPPFVLDFIRTALAHETAINPDITKKDCLINIKIQNSHNLDADMPHTDVGQDASVYIMTSPPTTEQFSGVVAPTLYNDPKTRTITEATEDWVAREDVSSTLARSSHLPWTIYRSTDHWLHSIPVPMDRSDTGIDKRRFFIRAIFTDPR